MSEQADRPAPAAPSLTRSLVQFCESVRDQQEGVALAAAPPICRVGGPRLNESRPVAIGLAVTETPRRAGHDLCAHLHLRDRVGYEVQRPLLRAHLTVV